MVCVLCFLLYGIIKNMLNPFPDLLAFGLVAPLLLRVALGMVFVDFGWSKLRRDGAQKAALFEALGLRPGVYYAVLFGVIELAAGILLIIGLYAQIAALAAAIISAAAYYIKKKYPEKFQSDRCFFCLLFIIALSLLFSGAGFMALDLPL